MTAKQAESNQALHRRAEEKLMSGTAETRKLLSLDEANLLLHDLQVHQIELEMENEELRKTQAELAAARTRYFDLYDLAPVGYCTVSENGLIMEANLTAANLLGESRGALVRQPFSRFILKDDQDIYYLHRKLLAETHSTSSGQADKKQMCELRMVKMDGSQFWVQLEASISQNPDGAMLRIMLSDISERKQAEEELRKSKEEILELASEQRIILSFIPLGVCFLKKRTVQWANPAFDILFGYEVATSKGMETSAFYPDIDTYERVGETAYAAIADNGICTLESEMKKKDGSLFFCGLVGQAVLAEKPENGTIWILTDITAHKQAQDQIKRSLQEKEVLLKEIHHRVKNNMQVIYSLLNLQAKEIADSSIRAMFEKSRDRINSMALIHESLYQSKDLAHIDFKKYLEILVQSIARTYSRHEVNLSVEMEPLAIDVNIGIPCGLIVNELVSNSLKHAFPEGRKGTVKVGLNRNSEGDYLLTVADNGIGFPRELDFRNSSSMGMELVNLLTVQLHGTIDLATEEGTSFRVTFPGERKGTND